MTRMDNLQHPMITAIERWGYPEQPKVAHQCSECDEPIYEGESCFHFPRWGWVCEHCADMAYTVAD